MTKRIVGAVFTDPEIGRVDMSERAAPEASGGSGLPGSTYSGKAKPWKSAGLLASSMLWSTPRRTACSAPHVLANDSAELVWTYIALMSAGALYQAIREVVHVYQTAGGRPLQRRIGIPLRSVGVDDAKFPTRPRIANRRA